MTTTAEPAVPAAEPGVRAAEPGVRAAEPTDPVAEPAEPVTGQVPAEPVTGQVPAEPPFILYLDGEEYAEEMRRLASWVTGLLLPVYGREVTSQQPWCPRWWEHPEAVARLHALWLAWQECTDPAAGASGPSVWHRDHLGPVLAEVRSPTGPFAGCKPGGHRAKAAPVTEPCPY